MSWRKYAYVEFRHSFRPFGEKVPGGRDFVSLTAIFALLVLIVAICSSLHRGIIVNFTDSLIGYMPGAGVPIWVSLDAGIVTSANSAYISDQFENSAAIGGSAHPQPESLLATYDFNPFFEVEKNYLMTLPEGSWETPSKDDTDFAGWATATNSPLWQWASVELAGHQPMNTLLLSRSAFDRGFRRIVYEAGLEKIAPDPMVAEWREQNPPGQPLRSLIVRVPYSAHLYRAHLFEVAWVDSFPAVQRIAYIMPLELYRAFQFSAQSELIKFLPELLYDPSQKMVRALRIDNANQWLPAGAGRDAFVSCLGDGARISKKTQSFDLRVEMDAPIRERDAEKCLSAAGVAQNDDVQISEALATHLKISPTEILVPCGEGKFENVSDEAYAPCAKATQDGNAFGRLPVFREFGSGLIYAKERGGIAELVTAIRDSRLIVAGNAKAKRQFLYISDLYQSSINRLNYLIKVVDFIVFPAGVFFGTTVVYLVFIQLYVFLSKRKRNYGILMARGMRWSEIYRIVLGQFVAAMLLASLIAFVALVLAKEFLQQSFSQSSAYFLGLKSLGLKAPALMDRVTTSSLVDFIGSLSLSARDLTLGVVVVSLVLFPVTLISLYRLPLHRRTMPMELVSL